MSARVTREQAAEMLRRHDRILLLTHQFPDGDTVGCGYALATALRRLGKQAQVLCSDTIPDKYAYITAGFEAQTFEPDLICAVDVADPKLLGEKLQDYAGRVALCIDHHVSNVGYAENLLLDETCGAACMIVMDVIKLLGVEIDAYLASALYTGIATDTGCFKYGNTTPKSHRQAAELIECGADYPAINRSMFDIKSRSRLELERRALAGIRFYFEGRVAVMVLSTEMIEKSGADDGDLEGMAPLPRQIEGVWAGITMRQRADGAYKVSLRTGDQVNASEICKLLGGGGHPAAAGCTLEGSEQEAIDRLLAVIREQVPKIGG